MSNHFPIAIDVEEEKVGSVLRQLDAMPGVVTIHLKVAKSNPAQHMKMLPPQPKKVPNIQALVHPRPAKRKGQLRELIAGALAKGAMHVKLLEEIFTRHGLSHNSVSPAITKMLSEKSIERLGPGTYRLTNRGQRQYLNAVSQEQPKRRENRFVENNKGVRGVILKELARHSLTHHELKDLIIGSGYTKANMYNAVPKLRIDGFIQRSGDVYTITERGRGAIAPDTSANEVSKNSMLLEHEAQHGETS